MSAFTNVRRLAWDTETTGVNPHEDRIVTAAIVVRGGGKPDRTFSYLINPGVPIPEDATDLHGVTDAIAQADGRDPKDALDEIATYLADAICWGMPVVAFNTAFDWSILHHDLARHGLATVEERISAEPLMLVDPHVIDRQMDRYVKGSGLRKLKPTAERYEVELDDWHTAEADALAALLIADALFEKYPKLNEYAPESLFAAQKRWRTEQQAGLQKWFRTKATAEEGGDPNKVIDGSWPLIPAQRGGEV